MQQMQNDALNNQMQEEVALQQQLEKLEAFVKQGMTKDAVERYGNVKLADPEKAVQALAVMARALQTKQVSQINDDLLKHFLAALTPEKKSFNLRIV